MLVLLGLAWGLTASGATVKAGSGRSETPSGHHHCKCASACRGASCCCASDAPDVPARARPLAAPAPLPGPKDAGPCLDSAPCGGGDGVPASATGLALCKAIAPASFTPFPAGPAARSAFPASETLHPAPPAARLDDPPERHGDS
jgi:hypothetical protein